LLETTLFSATTEIKPTAIISTTMAENPATILRENVQSFVIVYDSFS
jgi:hypothetical protein